MLLLRLFGGAGLEDTSGTVSGRAVQRRRLALLAILALEHPRPVSRDKLIAWLWPEHDTDRARHLLRDSLYLLRSTLGEEALPSTGDELRLDPEFLRCDVWEFETALAQDQPSTAVQAYAGPLLDGFHVGGAAELERWIDGHRERLGRNYAGTLERLAEGATAATDHRSAVEWWRRLAAGEPYNARVTLHLMKALEAAGDRAGAIQQARIHATLLEQEFGAEPDPEIEAMAESLRTAPTVRAQTRPAAGEIAGGSEELATLAESAHVERIPARLTISPAAETERALVSAAVAHSSPRIRRVRRAFVLPAIAGIVLASTITAILLVRDRVGTPRASMATTAPRPKSIAVLPCANLSGDPEQEYFSDGLTEELTGVLAQIHSLSVVARTSAFAFKGENRDIREVASKLNVGTIVECSVRRAGGRVRVTAQLINAADGFHLWAETYEQEGTDVFAIQSDLALRIATALEAELGPGERARMARRPTVSPAAHTLYQKGRYFWNQRTRSGYVRAIEYYERAIEADPRYAEAYAGLATVYSMEGIFGQRSPKESAEKTRENALKALTIDPDLAEAHTVLGGYYQAHVWDSDGAEREHRRALELGPNYSTAHFWYGNFLTAMRRFDEAIAHKEKAVELDPLSSQLTWALAITLVAANRPDEAMDQFRNAIELDSSYYPAYAGLGDAYQMKGQLEKAVEAYRRAVMLAGENPEPKAGLARVLGLVGQKEEARTLLAELEALAARTGVYAPYVAGVFPAIGDVDRAFDWLDRSYQQRHPSLRFIDGPAFAQLEGDPRYRDLRRRIGLPN